MPPAPKITADDIRDLADGVRDLVAEMRRMGDRQGDHGAKVDALHTRVDALTAALSRLETAHSTGPFARLLTTLERAPWQVGALLASILLVLVLILGHVDLVALAAAYSQPKGSP